MKKTLILFVTTLLYFNVIVKSQTPQDSSEHLSLENTQNSKADLAKILQENTKYPIEALKNKIQGDVILSFNIDKNGNMNNLKIISSPSEFLTTSSLISFDQAVNKWSPSEINGTPVNKVHIIVFRYRFYLNTQPIDYKEKTKKYVEKQKYDKALKTYNTAITENRFDYELYELRSKLNDILGDAEKC
jgi:TonB family protein